MGDSLKIKFNNKGKVYEQICELSTYISELNLNKVKNDKLINLIVKQIKLVEKEFFIKGFKSGLKYQIDQMLEQAQQEYLINEQHKQRGMN
ncbi:MAG: hypothetical protein AB9844_00865 [Clostridiaceae bacterium]